MVDLDVWGGLFETAAAWYRGAPFDVVQLIYPDRNGFLPYEPGFEHRLRFAQPVIGTVRPDHSTAVHGTGGRCGPDGAPETLGS